MSAFDSLFRTANTANLALLESELEAMGRNLVLNLSAATDSTTSSKTVLTGSASIAADELVEIIALADFSVSAGTVTGAAHKLVGNSTQLDLAEMSSVPIIATGQGVRSVLHGILYDVSGSITIRNEALITSGTGTLYLRNIALRAFTMKRR